MQQNTLEYKTLVISAEAHIKDQFELNTEYRVENPEYKTWHIIRQAHPKLSWRYGMAGMDGGEGHELFSSLPRYDLAIETFTTSNCAPVTGPCLTYSSG